MKHYISALLANRPGVLTRISVRLSQRGFNIKSIAAGETDDVNVTRITLVVDGDETIAGQVVCQLEKLIDVILVRLLNTDNIVQRDLVLVKIDNTSGQQGEIYDLVNIMGGEIIDVSLSTLMLAFYGNTSKVDLFVELLSKYKILEIARTGMIALDKGERTIFSMDED